MELHELSKKHGLHCVQSEDTLTWTDTGCDQADVQDNYVICQCTGINKYYTVNGQLNPRKEITVSFLNTILDNHP